MLTQDNIEKNMLQLIGITCLFIASKMEVRNNRQASKHCNKLKTAAM